MTLLFATTALGPYWASLVDEFASRCEVQLLTGRPWPGLEEGHDRVTVVGHTRRILQRERGISGYGGGVLVPSLKVVPLLLRSRPDVVFTAGFTLWTGWAMLLGAFMRWPVVILWEGSTPRVDHRDSRLRTTARRILASRAAAVLTNSRAGEAYLLEHLRIPPGRVRRRPYQLPDTARWADAAVGGRSGHADLRLLVVGKLIGRKGLHHLFDALGRLQADGTGGWRLDLVGTGPDEAALRERARLGGYGDRVRWVGFVPYDELGEVFADADVLVFPTLEDTWGMVALEALAMGLPVIASTRAGASDLVADGGAGILCDPVDVDGLADAVTALVRDRGLVAEQSEAATSVMRHHRAPDAAAYLYAVACELTGRHPAG